jgi:NAD(P)-dependent dehydrogenase (short-subunit alcohol dehydrogenase family)
MGTLRGETDDSGRPSLSETHGKILVTGATGTIGGAIVEHLLKDGAAVVASGSRETPSPQLAQLMGDFEDLSYVRCDVADEAQVKAMVSEAQPLAGAVNAAGIVGDSVSTVDYESDHWQRVIDVNLRGTWLCLKYQIESLLKSDGGSIVNISSIAGLVGEIERSPYVASKAGIVGLTKTAAVEYAERGVRVNVVSPGPIDTPQFHIDIGPPDSPRYGRIVKQIPIRRMGDPTEIAGAVAWLLSDSSSFVVGHELVVDGGLTIEGVQV